MKLTSRQKYKDFGKLNPKKEQELREFAIRVLIESCPVCTPKKQGESSLSSKPQ